MKTLLFVACLTVALFSAGCCTPGIIGSQSVTLSPQETSMWCWAASGQMCMNFIESSAAVTQCDEANKEFGRTDCCNSPTPAACVQGGWPQPDKYNFTFKTTSDAALSWAQVKDQIYCKKKPFAFSWHWPGGGGHMMVAIGYVTLEGTNYVTVNDPWAPNVGNQWVNTYDWYVASAGDHTHWNDYYDITYKGGQ